MAMGPSLRGTIEVQETRPIARRQCLLGDQLSWKNEIEVRDRSGQDQSSSSREFDSFLLIRPPQQDSANRESGTHRRQENAVPFL